MKLKRWMLCLPSAALLIAADQVLKRWVAGQKDVWLPQGGGPRIPGLIGLTYHTNTGAAWGLLDGVEYAWIFFVALAAAAAAAIVWALVKGVFPSAVADGAMTLALGGALGNAIDRALPGHAVVDYLEFLFVRFPVFNLADVCLVCGGVLLAAYTLFAGGAENKSHAVDTDGPA
ncbi:MAG: signal peptidase II [Oscillospiraceae bacterium]|nr:signal peptidase II [Oscillospiraceae bacterium]